MFTVPVIVGALFLPQTNFLERFFLDTRFYLASEVLPGPAQSDELAIVFMDAQSEAVLGVPVGSAWRQFFPRVIEILNAAGARTIVFDLEFIAEESQWDTAFRWSVIKAGNVVAGEWEAGTTQSGLAGAFADIGSLRVPGINGVPRWLDFGAQPLAAVALGETRNESGEMWISYTSSRDYFPSFSFSDVYGAEEGRLSDSRRTPLSFFKDKIILIGLDLPGEDRYALPNTLGAKIPGVYVHAYAMESLRSGDAVIPAGIAQNIVVLALFSLSYAFCFFAVRTGIRRTVVILVPLAAVALIFIAFWTRQLWISVAPIAASSATAVVLHRIVRRRTLQAGLKSAIGFDPELVTSFRRKSEGGIVRQRVAILCADIRGYTAFVAGGAPAEISEVMNQYLQEMENAISEYGGYVNKYVGDEIIAVFGFPLERELAETRAVDTGIAMMERFSGLVRGWEESDIHHFSAIGIGIDAGKVTFAEVGGRARRQFDIIGNAINGAARLQTLTKEIGHAFVVSAKAHSAIDERRKSLFSGFEKLGTYSLRGQGEREVYAWSQSRK